jgi:4'-phosphopantetheinyl transferase
MTAASVEVWRVDATADGGFAALLDSDERARAQRFAFAADRARFVLRRGVRRVLLAAHPGAAVSVSSTPGEVLVALARGTAVGADVERPRAGRERLHARVCSPREQAALRDGRASFHMLWTRKEAVLKLLGVGLARPPAMVDVLVPGSLAVPEPVWVRDLPGGLPAAVACARRPERLRIVRATAAGGALAPVEETDVD